jgi:hypothetical protein
MGKKKSRLGEPRAENSWLRKVVTDLMLMNFALE